MLIRLRHSWYELGFPSNTGMYESLVKLVSKVEELVLDMKSNKKELCVPKKQVNLSSLRTDYTSNLCVPKKPVNLSSLRTDYTSNYNYQGRCQELEAQVDAIKALSRKVGVGVEVDGENGVAQWSPGAQPLRCQYQLGSSCRIKLHEVLVQKVVQAKHAKSFAA
jgi:hypothetical protein